MSYDKNNRLVSIQGENFKKKCKKCYRTETH